tara:strand:+ start:4312 stop:4734 length:423 start_codon:yes stop_codon:yes gene_type:complete
MVLYTYEELENKRKQLIKRDKDFTLDNSKKVAECREIILNRHPNLFIGTRDFDAVLRHYLMINRADNLKKLSKLYKHAKNRVAYNYTHWKCGLNQKIPQRASRIISQFLGDETKTKIHFSPRPFSFLSKDDDQLRQTECL